MKARVAVDEHACKARLRRKAIPMAQVVFMRRASDNAANREPGTRDDCPGQPEHRFSLFIFIQIGWVSKQEQNVFMRESAESLSAGWAGLDVSTEFALLGHACVLCGCLDRVKCFTT